MMKSVLMIFIDGVGIGENDPAKNPFIKKGFNTFTEIFGSIPHLENQYINNGDNYIFPTDALLGVGGIPQSGTGQVSILCGVNAPQIVGKHFGPFPYSTTVPIIKEQNIFKYFKSKRKKVLFANAYPKVFFDYINSGKTRFGTISMAALFSKIKINRATDVRKGLALTPEITNERWNTRLKYNLPVVKPELAAKRLLKLALRNNFTLYEYYLTDHIGHGRIAEEFDDVFNNLDRFLFTILKEMDRNKITLLVCSDHGNLEDISVKNHTLNPALTLTAGLNSLKLALTIKNISQIKGAIIKYCS